ncbi:MAG TPA: enoyl-CoA hydratase/isomerase family protein, partial [Acidimicrobiales bacterium]|nr:enoyl-CoA hydratase/isomerase family protein [Acidimicrobiales bacterium]
MHDRFGDVAVALDTDFVATVTICRPPNNYFDVDLIRSLADAYEALDADAGCRAIVLCSQGRHFCAGADFGGSSGATAISHAEPESAGGAGRLYHEASRLFAARKPVVAAVQGAAIGGGLGLACSADFRLGCPEARFAANFARLGFHHGFGLTVTLPPIVGQQRCLEMLYSGRRISGEEAASIGLCDRIVELGELPEAAHAMAAEIAASAPLAVESIRLTMRGELADRIRAATARELR